MSEAQHTPGPWKYLEDHDGYAACAPLTIHDSASNDLANVYSRDDATVDISREQAIANARLIAAAPDMLAALHAAHDYLDSHGNGWEEAETLTKIRSAITAAEGGAV